jgi:DNA polymerase sigma
MERYKNGKIYRLVCSDGYFYIGSTCKPLCKRFWDHKGGAKRNSLPAHEHFNRVGWDKVNIILIEDFPCENKQNLFMRETEIILENLNNPKCLNKKISIKDPEQRKVEKNIKRLEWRETHQENDKKAVKKYYQKNKDILREKARQKRLENPPTNEQKKIINQKQREKYAEKKGKNVRKYSFKKISTQNIENEFEGNERRVENLEEDKHPI